MPQSHSTVPGDPAGRIGLLLSGGLDSSVLLGHLLDKGYRVQPFYIRSGLVWEEEEFQAANLFLRAMRSPRLEKLVTLELPLSDLYQDHWSISGRAVPDETTPDQAVYLPGRNALLIVKTAVWCIRNGIDQLALGVLGSNPFPDATSDFFQALASALGLGMNAQIHVVVPFAQLNKRQVMELGRRMPLGLTFSCLAPVGGRHCGRCNKCAERQAAFRLIDVEDPTSYATVASAPQPRGA